MQNQAYRQGIMYGPEIHGQDRTEEKQISRQERILQLSQVETLHEMGGIGMRLEFIGADHEVTGSCHYLQVGALNILVDYGMEQGANIFENMPLPVPAEKIDYVFLTHAHIDHSGMLPKLYRDGFRGSIITTETTAALCDIMLRDSAHIQQQEAEWKNKKGARRGVWQKVDPVYTMEDAMAVLKLFKGYRYGKKYQLCNGVEFRFTDIGHLLGSASIELWLTENAKGVAAGNPVGAPEGTVTRKIVFSGDIGNYRQPLLRDPDKTDSADYVVMESTYGDRLHEAEKGNYVEDLAAIIRRTLLRGGNVVIPSFAVGRTQEILYFIRQIKAGGLIPELPDFPVYVDSPLAVEATEVFGREGAQCYDEEALAFVKKGINPLQFPRLYLTITADESKKINTDDEPKVIIAASGMCDAGRIKHHLKYNLWRPECTILFVGYQAVGTPGRRIVDGADEVNIFGEPVSVRAEICRLQGLSGHADKAGLLDWIEGFTVQRPSKVFVVHGEDAVAASFADCLRREHNFGAMAPYSGTVFNLSTGEFEKITEGVRLRRTSEAGYITDLPLGGAAGHTASASGQQTGKAAVSDSYTKVQLAARQLALVIEKGRGLPNKDLDALAGALQELAKKYRVDA